MTDPKEDVAFLVLQRYGTHREIALYPTSRIVRANCGHLCWLSPQGEARFATSYTQCTDCLDADVTPEEEREMFAVPGAVDSWRAIAGDKVADEIRQRLREKGIREE